MESLILPLSSAFPIIISAPRHRLSLFPIAAKPNDSTSSSPDRHLSITPFSKDVAMGLELSAAMGTSWTLYFATEAKVMAGVEATVPWLIPSETEKPSASNLKEVKDEKDVPYKDFKRFDFVQDALDHNYAKGGSKFVQPSKDLVKRIQHEWKILENDLPGNREK